MNIERGISRYDLGVTMVEMNETLRVEFEYNTQLFAASRMMRMAEHYAKLLESIVAEPQQRLSQLELMREEERRLLLTEWNQTATSYSFEACVHELVEQQAESRPKALALTYAGYAVNFRRTEPTRESPRALPSTTRRRARSNGRHLCRAFAGLGSRTARHLESRRRLRRAGSELPGRASLLHVAGFERARTDYAGTVEADAGVFNRRHSSSASIRTGNVLRKRVI